ncbi:endonuclease [Haliovirga abyssi]|uniref:Uncharacterized protein n=1 Tax=Haliovirga abyssi TaxID=2996794 RepID=A0AAU9DIG9_9FUSO|nr:endonuclease [Haliovirga abyssi]BDU51382.1 hypothetical protein HLVA_19510 [Haliovirga abyssi]
MKRWMYALLLSVLIFGGCINNEDKKFTGNELNSAAKISNETQRASSSNSDLFFSGYVECAGGNNKALGIYNPTGNKISLVNNYFMMKLSNPTIGDTWTSNNATVYKFEVGKVISPKDVFVVYNAGADDANILGTGDMTSAITSYNGNDDLALVKDENNDGVYEVGIDTILDVIGKMDGTNWGKDITLERKATVTSGNAIFDLNEWNSLPTNTFDHIGLFAGSEVNSASDLFFSGYVECAGGNNKALGIYNPTGSDISLVNNYFMMKLSNPTIGDTWTSSNATVYKFEVGKVISPKDVFVVYNAGADDANILGAGDMVSPITGFNGNDDLALVKDENNNGTYEAGIDIILDVIGKMDGTNWGKDITLERKATVTSGNVTFDLNEWNSLPTNTFDHIGLFAGSEVISPDNGSGNVVIPTDTGCGNYYDSIGTETGSALKSKLNDLIDNQTELSYSQAYNALIVTDRDPNNSNNVIEIYTGRSVNGPKKYDGGKGWNREHVWAKTHGDFGTKMGPGTDLHHIRVADVSVNSDRGSKEFDNGGTPNSEATECNSDSDSWEPRDEVKGDIARMLFYMAVRYEGEHGEPDLKMSEDINDYSKAPTIGKLSVLLEWNREDPVSETEIRRNNIIDKDYQHNRNPFIDHPEYAERIWGN